MPPIEAGFAEIVLVSTPISRTRRLPGEIFFPMLSGRVPGQARTVARSLESKYLHVGKASRVLAVGRAEASATSYAVFGMSRSKGALDLRDDRMHGRQAADFAPLDATRAPIGSPWT